MAELVCGAHLSVAGGFARTVAAAQECGATTFAFFTRNPRGGAPVKFEEADVQALLDYVGRAECGPLVVHAPYTLNLCSAKEDVVSFGRRAMREDILRLERIPGTLFNFHPGSHVKQGTDLGISLIAEGLDEVLEEGLSTRVLLETMAGKGSEVGRTFEELARIIEGAKCGDMLGVCLDTCHVFDAGYDIVGDLDGVLDEFDRVLGLDRLCALHLNDSKNDLGSHKDRHEKLGQGHIGYDTFRNVVRNERLRHLPMILETPNDLCGYAAEISWLREAAAEPDADAKERERD